MNAHKSFDSLKRKHQREMLGRFEYWQAGYHQDRYFHGFTELDCRNCFVFKRKQAGTYYRFYGFLINPRILTDPGYLLCVLVFYSIKNTEATDPALLKALNKLRATAEVVQAIKAAFPEHKGGKHGALDIHKR